MIVVVAAMAAVLTLALAWVARDVAIRVLADRADARVRRVAEAEKVASEALRLASAHGDKLRELEQKLGAFIGRRVRA